MKNKIDKKITTLYDFIIPLVLLNVALVGL